MKDLLNKILYRNNNYISETSIIIECFADKLNKAMQHLIKDSRTFIWEDIDIIKENTNFAYLLGYCKLVLNDEIAYPDGTRVKITEENINDKGKTYVKIMLPINVLNDGTAIDIYESLKQYDQLKSVVSKEELEELIIEEKCETFSDIFKNDRLLARITRPALLAGFNTKNMSDEQVTKLAFFTLYNKDEKDNERKH